MSSPSCTLPLNTLIIFVITQNIPSLHSPAQSNDPMTNLMLYSRYAMCVGPFHIAHEAIESLTELSAKHTMELSVDASVELCGTFLSSPLHKSTALVSPCALVFSTKKSVAKVPALRSGL